MDRVLISYCLGRELLSLPGIGEHFADEILRIREEKGNIELNELRSIRGLRVTDELIDLIDFRPYELSNKEAQRDIKTQNIQHSGLINPSTYSNEGSSVPFHFNPSVPPPMTQYPPQTIGAYGSPYYGEQERRSYNSFYPQGGARDLYGVNRRQDWVDDNSNTRAHSYKPVTVPRHISYDGTWSWRSFFVRFTTFAQEQQWTGRQRKNNLCWCLQGKASNYFAMVMEREPNLEYFDSVRRLEKRFSS